MQSIESTEDHRSFPGVISRYLPLVAWMAFISFASSASFSASNTSTVLGPLLKWIFPNASEETLVFLHFIVRKAAHFLEYALLGLLAARAFKSSAKSAVRSRWFIISAALVIVYALLDEYHQSFVPSRTASLSDSLVDMFGGLTSLLILRKYAASNPRGKGTETIETRLS